jgi:hypothetical protein
MQQNRQIGVRWPGALRHLGNGDEFRLALWCEFDHHLTALQISNRDQVSHRKAIHRLADFQLKSRRLRQSRIPPRPVGTHLRIGELKKSK